MANPTFSRSAQTDAPQGSEQAHTLILLVNDRPGSVDRVIGLLRRRRANMQMLVLSQSERPEVVRITIGVNDSNVGVEHLVEQLRKVIDVVQVVNVVAQEAVVRELALIKVAATDAQVQEIRQYAQRFDAHIVDMTNETVIVEQLGSSDQINELVQQLAPYGIREIARSGSIAMARDV
jgi:acetolactate synthase-1/3 small subunit